MYIDIIHLSKSYIAAMIKYRAKMATWLFKQGKGSVDSEPSCLLKYMYDMSILLNNHLKI